MTQTDIKPFGLLAPQTLLGRGARNEAAARIASFGRRVLLVRSRSVAWADALRNALAAEGVAVAEIAARGEPDLSQVIEAVGTARAQGADCIAAVGGGSAIDLGKAVAALAPSESAPLDHFEIVGLGLPLAQAPLPFVAIPSTFGTGAEATKNAVVTMPEQRLKVSLRDDRMIPRLAIVDPALADGSPRGVTLASGLDAVTQVIEPYLSTGASPLTDALCRDAIPRGLAALARLMEAEDAAARDALARVSYLGGVALANAGLGAVHGLAGVIGGVTGAAHGAICGRLLPGVLAANRDASSPGSQTRARLDEIDGWIAEALGSPGPTALAHFMEANALPRLADLGLGEADPEAIAGAAARSSSMRYNPVTLDQETLVRLIREAV